MSNDFELTREKVYQKTEEELYLEFLQIQQKLVQLEEKLKEFQKKSFKAINGKTENIVTLSQKDIIGNLSKEDVLTLLKGDDTITLESGITLREYVKTLNKFLEQIPKGLPAKDSVFLSKEDIKNIYKPDSAIFTKDGVPLDVFNETLLKKIAENKLYTETAILNAGAGVKQFAKESELKAFTPKADDPKFAYTFDTHHSFEWVGNQWKDLGLSELELAKEYFHDNDPSKNIELEDGSNIINCTENAVYGLLSSNSYVGLPSNYSQVVNNSSSNLTVKRINSAYILQTLVSNQNPNIGWVRRVLVSATNTAEAWIDLQSDYNGGITSNTQSIKTNQKCGTWLVTSASDLPSDWVSGSLGFLNIERAGSTYKYTLTQASNPVATFICTSGNTTWQRLAMGKLTANNNFNDEYSYFGIFTNYDANSCLKTGQYTLNGTPSNIPSWMNGNTIFLDVFKAGAFYYQKAIIRQDMNQLAQRMGFLSGGVITWTDWGNPASGSSSGEKSDTSLNGKRIAWFGDSMIDQSNYPKFVDDRYGCTSLNFGFSGMRATHYPTRIGTQDDMCLYKLVQYVVSGDFTGLKAAAQKAKTDYSYDQIAKINTLSTTNFNDVDVLVIAYGTNDWTSEASTVGTTLNPTSIGYNFKETMCFCIETMLTAFPHLQIVLVSPTWRLRAEWGVPLDPAKTSDNTTVGGEYLIQYVDAIKDVADKYHLPFYDFYRQGGINSFNYDQYLRDGVHQIVPYGKQYWANRIGSFLSSVI